jgi:DNA-binding transcriptional regulator YbjK
MFWLTTTGRALMTLSPRMTQLLDAGVQVVAEEGLRGLTHRAVDRRAGLPEGSCSAYLRTRLALLTALAEYVSARFAEDVRSVTARIGERPGDDDCAVRETSQMFLRWLEHPELLQTRLELTLEGQRQPELADVSIVWGRQLLAIVTEVMVRAGHPDPQERAATLIAAMDGVLLRALREAPEERRIFLERSLRLLISSVAGQAAVPGS